MSIPKRANPPVTYQAMVQLVCPASQGTKIGEIIPPAPAISNTRPTPGPAAALPNKSAGRERPGPFVAGTPPTYGQSDKEGHA